MCQLKKPMYNKNYLWELGLKILTQLSLIYDYKVAQTIIKMYSFYYLYRYQLQVMTPLDYTLKRLSS